MTDGQEVDPPKKLLERSLVWFALGVIVTAVAGTIGAQSYLRNFVDERIQDPRVNPAISRELGVSEGRVEELIANRLQVDGSVSEEFVENQIAVSLEPYVPFKNMKGAVVAFDRSVDRGGGDVGGGCPVGWRLFTPAGGRMIVGAGPHPNADQDGIPLTDYRSFQEDPEEATGGVELHTLTIEEMPVHRHLPVFQNSETPAQNVRSIVSLLQTDKYQDYDLGPGSGGRRFSLGFASAADAGGSQPHNNMPPYIALYYCKKEIE